MKKVISIILVASMLLVMIPAMIINAAEGETVAPTTAATKIGSTFASAYKSIPEIIDVKETVSSSKNYNAFTSSEVQWGEVWDTSFDDKSWTKADTSSSSDDYASARLTAAGEDGLNIRTVGKMEKASTVTGVMIQTYQSRIGAPKIRFSADNISYDLVIEASTTISTGQSNRAFVYFELPEEYQNKIYEYVEFSLTGTANTVYQIYDIVLIRDVAETTGRLPTDLDDVPVLPYSSTSNKSSYVADREIQWNEVWDTDADGKNLLISDTGSSADNMASAKLLADGTDGLKIETVGIMEKVSNVRAIVIQTYQNRFNGVTISLSKDNVTYDEVVYLTSTYYDYSSNNYPYLYCEIPEEYASQEYKYVKLSIDGVANTVYQLYQCVLYTDPVVIEDGASNVYAGVQSKTYTHETKGDCYALRFVQTLDESVLTSCTSAGFEITADYGAETVKDCSKDTNMVYTSIIAADEVMEAADLKKDTDTYVHEYIVALSVIDISVATYDDIIFTVKPYVVTTEGEKVYAGEYTIIYNDGVNMSVFQGTPAIAG